MTLDERILDRLLYLGSISDLRESSIHYNNEDYANQVLTMIRDVEDYFMAIRDEEDYTDMAIDMNDATRYLGTDRTDNIREGHWPTDYQKLIRSD